MSTRQPRDVVWARLVGIEGRDRVDSLAGLLLALDLPAAMQFDGGDRAGEGESAGGRVDPADLDRPRFDPPVSGPGFVSTTPDLAPPTAGF
jgi:hypothetical protein